TRFSRDWSSDVCSSDLGERITFGDPERERLTSFLYERMAGQLREQDYTPQQIEAVIAREPQFLNEIPRRLAAIRAFSALPEAERSEERRVGKECRRRRS